MATITVTYYLKEPKKRPNPFRIGPSVVFVNGAFTRQIDEAKLPSVDKFMKNYGAFRTPPELETEDDGSDQVQTDGNVTDGEGQVSSTPGPDGGSSDEEKTDGASNDETSEGNSGSTADEGKSSGAKAEGLTPVKRRTKAETQAGLDTTQAAEFRASGADDALAWFKENYPEEYALAHPDEEEDIA